MEIQTLKRLLETLALCLVIASVQALILPKVGYDIALVYSLSIGLSIVFLIEAGRRVLRPDPQTDWPKGLSGPLMVLLACSLGFVLGASLAAFALGHPAIWDQDPIVLKTSLLVTAISGFGMTAYYYTKGHSALLSAAKEASDRAAAQAQLQRLSAQLQPHMLFNTLANIRALVSTQPDQALAMLDRLNALLRTSLQAGRVESHTLAQEFSALDDYLALMQMRLGERLKVKLVLPDALQREPILALLAQPLVENAILHGIEPSVQGGTMWVIAGLAGKHLQLDVYNSGNALREDLPASAHSVGMALVRERLSQQWGANASFSLEAVTFEGQVCTRARLCWPLKGETP